MQKFFEKGRKIFEIFGTFWEFESLIYEREKVMRKEMRDINVEKINRETEFFALKDALCT